MENIPTLQEFLFAIPNAMFAVAIIIWLYQFVDEEMALIKWIIKNPGKLFIGSIILHFVLEIIF